MEWFRVICLVHKYFTNFLCFSLSCCSHFSLTYTFRCYLAVVPPVSPPHYTTTDLIYQTILFSEPLHPLPTNGIQVLMFSLHISQNFQRKWYILWQWNSLSNSNRLALNSQQMNCLALCRYHNCISSASLVSSLILWCLNSPRNQLKAHEHFFLV